MRILATLAVAVCFALLSYGQELRFDNDGKFKIVQFTDLHIKWNDARSDTAFTCMRNTIEAEHPDLIVVTGDIIYSTPALENFTRVMEFLAQFDTPFAITFGNHDREFGASNAELLKIAMQTPNCVASDTEGLSGDGNYVLEVRGNNGNEVKSVLYFLDSHQLSQLADKGVDGYAYVCRDQIEWYAQTSSKYASLNGGTPMPSLAFFHIPLPEYNQAASCETATLRGIRREKACAPQLNTGLFAAMKEQGDIMGIFVGHDHDNDYAVNWHGILLAYGRFTGGPTEYNHLPNGARVITLTEGSRTIDSYIRLADGTIEQRTSFPGDYTM